MTPRATGGIVAQLLGGEEYRFSFFQAVRLVDLLFAAEPHQRTGHGNTSHAEPLRFRTRASLAFPASELYALGFDPEDGRQFDPFTKQPRGLNWHEPRMPLDMTLNFFGLFGPKGVLPLHYAELVHRRIRLGDWAMRDFFDMLSHRLVAFFYRAWAKHHPAVGYEWSVRRRPAAPSPRGAPEPGVIDDFTRYVLSLVGLGQPSLQARMAVPDETFLYYSGLFAEQRRPALSLSALLRDYFDLSAPQVRITQFVPQTLPLPLAEQSQLGDWNCDLGLSTVLGDEVLLEGSKFEIVLGPFLLQKFQEFLPPQEELSSGDGFRRLVQLARFFVGPELDFDVRLLLKKESAYQCGLGGSEDTAAVLGVAAWLINELPEADLTDSVFPSTLVEDGV
ncbi:MAG: type VI secretion system baseplate subunit TssG [Polyangia bacterium]